MFDGGDEARVFGDDGLSFGLAGFEEFDDAEESADLIFENFKYCLDGPHAFAFGAFGFFELHESSLYVLVELSEGGLSFGFDVGDSCEVFARHASRVEGSHGELRAWLSDGLCGDDARGDSDIDHASRGEVSAVAFGAHALSEFAGEYGSDFYFEGGGDVVEGLGGFVFPQGVGSAHLFLQEGFGGFDGHGVVFVGEDFARGDDYDVVKGDAYVVEEARLWVFDVGVGGHDEFARDGVHNVFAWVATFDSFADFLLYVAAFEAFTYDDAWDGLAWLDAVLGPHDDVLCDVYEAAGEVSSVGGA